MSKLNAEICHILEGLEWKHDKHIEIAKEKNAQVFCQQKGG